MTKQDSKVTTWVYSNSKFSVPRLLETSVRQVIRILLVTSIVRVLELSNKFSLVYNRFYSLSFNTHFV